jgi:PRTRC genetic system protein C
LTFFEEAEMTIEIQQLERKFKYNQIPLPDPNPAFTVAQVRDFYSSVHPEILNAEIEGPEVEGNVHRYNFRRAVGTKGHALQSAQHVSPVPAVPHANDDDSYRQTIRKRVNDLLALVQIGWLDEADAHFVKQVDVRLRNIRLTPANRAGLVRLANLHQHFCSIEIAL